MSTQQRMHAFGLADDSPISAQRSICAGLKAGVTTGGTVGLATLAQLLCVPVCCVSGVSGKLWVDLACEPEAIVRNSWPVDKFAPSPG